MQDICNAEFAPMEQSLAMTYSSLFQEPARELPVLDHADVLVLGGGPGGIAAAISAARNGARTILVERFGCLGGTWTSGALGVIMPFPYVKGLFDEFTHRIAQECGWRPWSVEYGAGAQIDTEVAKRVLDSMITEAGVIPYFFAQAAAVFREGSQVRGVVIESKEGRQVITAKYFIDATGDGDVSAMAGVPFEQGRSSDGACQPMSLIFKLDGADRDRAHAHSAEDPEFVRAWRHAKELGEVTVPREDVLMFSTPKYGQFIINTSRIIGKDATKIRDVTEAMIEGRKQAAEITAFFKKHIRGFEDAMLTETAAHVGVRESRRIRCDYRVTADDVVKVVEFEDCIARGNWYIDIHSPTGEGTERVHPPEGKSYGVPFRSIRAQGVDNLLVASRCLDCTHEAHAAIRVTPQIVAIGQGAGTAAALCVKQGLESTRELDSGLLRNTLREQGAYLP